MNIWMRMSLKNSYFKGTSSDRGKLILDSEHPIVVHSTQEASQHSDKELMDTLDVLIRDILE